MNVSALLFHVNILLLFRPSFIQNNIFIHTQTITKATDTATTEESSILRNNIAELFSKTVSHGGSNISVALYDYDSVSA